MFLKFCSPPFCIQLPLEPCISLIVGHHDNSQGDVYQLGCSKIIRTKIVHMRITAREHVTREEGYWPDCHIGMIRIIDQELKKNSVSANKTNQRST